MKHIRPILVLLLAALPLTWACGKATEPEAVFEVSPSSLTVDAPGGQVSFSVLCSEDWMAAADQSWARLQTVKGTGSKDKVTVKVSVSENELAETRSASVRVSTLSGKKKTVELIQVAGSGIPAVKGIATAADLLAFAAAVNSGGAVSPFMVDGEVTLLDDIDASSIREWIPIGTKENPLREPFNGKGHAIKNVSWTVDAEKYPDAGFIGYARNARITNLVFGSEESVVTYRGNASGSIGGIVGNAVSVTLTAVTNKAAHKVATGSSSLCMGGICGKADAASLLGDAEMKRKACVNDGAISASFACRVAGLVGYNEGTITGCTNNGAVTGIASNSFGPAWGCAYNASADKFTGNSGYGSVNGRAAVHATAVYPASAYHLEDNTVDWTQDTYYDWEVVEEKQLHDGVKYSHYSWTGMPRHMHVLEIDLSNPDIELTTDVIVGFPGETDKDFEDTLSLMEQVGYAAAFTFKYSPRKGTKAAEAADQVPDAVKKERLKLLNDLQARKTAENNRKYLGHRGEVLVEGFDQRQETVLFGKLNTFKMVYFPGEEKLLGTYQRVTVTKCARNSLLGRME